MKTPTEIIEQFGGSAKLAALLDFDKLNGTQRVNNWKRRGIPSEIILKHREIFLPLLNPELSEEE